MAWHKIGPKGAWTFPIFVYWSIRLKDTTTFRWNQCDQIGRFLECIGNKFYYKSSPNVWWRFGQLWKPLLRSQTGEAIFGQLLEKLGATFYFNIWSHWLKSTFNCQHYQHIFSTKYSYLIVQLNGLLTAIWQFRRESVNRISFSSIFLTLASAV